MQQAIANLQSEIQTEGVKIIGDRDFPTLVVDSSQLKAYNDPYGHPQGDRCWQKVAKILQESIRRPADLVARYGGEEFAVILPNTDLRGGLFVGKKIKNLLAEKQLPLKLNIYILPPFGKHL